MGEFKTGASTLETVVAYVLDEMNELSRWSELAETVATKVIRKFIELNMYHLDSTAVAYLPVNPDNTVDLPDDYISYNKIGIVVGNRVWTLTVRDDIALPREECCGEDIRTVTNTGDLTGVPGTGVGYYFPASYQNGQFVGGMYGLTGGFNTAYYRIDTERNQIVLDGRVPKCQIVLEYQSAGLSITGKTIIPRQGVEVLVFFALWRMEEGNPNLPQSQKERRKQQYEEKLEELRFYEASCTLDEWKDAIYSSATLAPKR